MSPRPAIIARIAQVFLRVTVAMLVIAGITRPGAAQARVSFGAGSARTAMTAQLKVGYAMKVRQSQSARIVERTATATIVELPLVAASNANWTLSVNTRSLGQDVEIMDAAGTWRDAASANPTLSRGVPTNGHPITVRLRLAPDAGIDSLPALRLVMLPSDG